MFFPTHQPILQNIIVKLEFSDIMHSLITNKATYAIFQNKETWKYYLKRFQLNDELANNPFWENFSAKNYKHFFYHYFKSLEIIRNNSLQLTMLDAVLLTNDLLLLKKFSQQRKIEYNEDLLERACYYFSLENLQSLIEKYNIKLTNDSLITFFKRQDLKIIQYGILRMEQSGITGKYCKLWENDLFAYYEHLLLAVIPFSNRSSIEWLLSRSGYFLKPEKIIFILKQVSLEVFDYLVITNPNLLRKDLVDQCALKQRMDLISYLTDNPHNLSVNISTLNALVKTGALENIEYFIDRFKIYPTDQTKRFVQQNPSNEVKEYINQYSPLKMPALNLK